MEGKVVTNINQVWASDIAYILRLLADSGKTVLLTSHLVEPLVTVCDSLHWICSPSEIRSFHRTEFPSIADLKCSTDHERKMEIARTLITPQTEN